MTRNGYILSITLVALVAIIGCGGGPGPEAVVAEYLRCLAVHDIEGLKKVVAEPQLVPALDQAEARKAAMLAENQRRGVGREEALAFYARTVVDFAHLRMRVERPGDIAVVYPQGYADVIYPDNEIYRQDFDGRRFFRLMQEGGRWKVWP